MKIDEILFESVSDSDLLKIELLLRLNSDFTDSYTEIEKSLKILKDKLQHLSVTHKLGLVNAALILSTVAIDYLSNPLWNNISNDPAALELKARMQKVYQESLAIYNQLLS